MLDLERFRVPVEKLRRVCEPRRLDFVSTAETPELADIIGQDRATRAIEFGIDMQAPGYNIFVMGPSGAGKTTTIHRYLARKAETRPVPPDWCYVNNFDDAYRPLAIELPAGRGAQFRADMDELVSSVREEIPKAFSSDQYEEHKSRLAREIDAKRHKELEELNRFATERGFTLLQTPGGLALAVVKDGQVVSGEDYQKLPAGEREELEALRPQIQEELERRLWRVRSLDDDARGRLQSLDQEIASYAVGRYFEGLAAKYREHARVLSFLDLVRKDVLAKVNVLRVVAQAEKEGAPDQTIALLLRRGMSPYDKYRVNVMVDNSKLSGAPVVVESNPNCQTLMGRIEHSTEFGALVTDFSLVKAGSLHRANGGYLVIDMLSLLQAPFAWECLKRALRDRRVRIDEIVQQLTLIAVANLEPEPIPLDCKVILVGDPHIYYLLHSMDPQFPKLFKVQADFAGDMKCTDENLEDYVGFVRARCDELKIPHFTPEAAAKIIEYGSRLVEDQTRLTTRFAMIADLVTEAGHFAKAGKHNLVESADVQAAIAAKVYRSNQIQQRIQEMIADGTILVDVDGEVVGQVNALSVVQLGDHAFGRPSRITARTFLGSAGVINIEREVKMSGRIHDKGVLILSGYLGGKYASEHPLNVNASICFEQSYEGIEGDSASSTELYALLSSLSGLPIKQNIAVTGSVNQRGEVQPIGGATYKVEGFFDVCKAKGLTGSQGAMIPVQNIRNLMLREDVVEAVGAGRFQILAVSTIDEGISILTGVEAGIRGPDGKYPAGTVNALVESNVREMALKGRRFGKDEEEHKKAAARDENSNASM